MGYTQKTGQYAEDLACQYLTKQGLSLISRNYHCRYGEIDLIMQQNDTIVFVEVRFRRFNNQVDGLSSIDSYKQQKLYRSAEHYLQKNKIHDSIPARFDIIAVSQKPTQDISIDWIKNAIEG